tara:strand:- start:3763 stop:4296 length:534 start_codon:yes stop_codon:yes gene_type:complete
MFVKYFILVLIFGSHLKIASTHAPWGQHQVYRQMHMLIMCSKKDENAFGFTKELAQALDIYLPKAKARVARARDEYQVIDLLRSHQMPLAIISYDLLERIKNYDNEYTDHLKKNTKLIFPFANMILLASKDFSSEKSLMVYEAIYKATNETELSIEIGKGLNSFIKFDEKIQSKHIK